MNKVTSFTSHTTSEGQRLSFTYSVINEENGQIVSDNNRMSIILLDIEQNTQVLEAISTIVEYLTGKISG